MFRRCFVFSLLVLAAACPAPNAEAAAARTAPKRPTSAQARAAADLKANYLEVGAAFSSFGLKPGWLITNKKLRLSGGGTRIDLFVDKREIVFDGLRVFLGESVILRDKAVYVSRRDFEKLLSPLLRPPARSRPRLIVLDPGHGGNDPGTMNTNLKLNEKGLTLDLARIVQRRLAALGYKVVFTRTNDTFIPLARRAEKANKANADLFVSIHFNATASGTVSGIETYSMTPQSQRSTGSDTARATDAVARNGNRSDAHNILLAYHVHRQLVGRLSASDRGLKRARFAVLENVRCPAVLIEGGYLSSDAEARKIATAKYRERLADAIVAGIQGYVTALPK